MNVTLGKNRCCSTNIVPPTKQGPQGAFGPGGIIGPKGYTGPIGSLGYTGPTGICYRGYKGAIGPQGNAGPQNGYVGPQGTPGSYIDSHNISFSISNASVFNTFTNIATTGTIIGTTTVTLTPGKQWTVYWDIYETLADSTNKFYIQLYDPDWGQTYEPYVFTSLHPCFLYSGLNTGSASGTDYFDLTQYPASNYVVQLMQLTTNGTKSIPNTNFSITFVAI